MSERDELLRLVEADLDGALSDSDRARLEAALRDDPALAAEARELRRLRDLFRSVPPARAPEGFGAAVVEATAGAETTAQQARAGFRLLRAAPWIAGLAAAALLMVLVRPWESSPVDSLGAQPTETADAPALESASREPQAPAADARPYASEKEAGPAGEADAPEPVLGGRRAREQAIGGGGGGGVGGGGASAPGRATGSRRGDGEPAADPPTPRPTAPAQPAATAATATEGAEADDAVGEPSPNAPAPEPPPPERTAAPADRTADAETADREGATLLDLKKPTRRYVVFEDAAAAQRYLASLQPAPETKDGLRGDRTKSERPDTSRARGGSKDAGSGASDAGDAEPSAAGSEASRGASEGLFRTSGPRVLGRVALATTDPRVGRALARAPDGGRFGESVPAAVLEAAEASEVGAAEAARRSSGKSRGKQVPELEESADDLPAESRERTGRKKSDPDPTSGPGSESGAGKGAGGPGVGGPTTGSGASARREERQEQQPAQIEIVVIVVPAGSLPPTGDTPR